MSWYRKKPVSVQAWPARELIHAATYDWQGLPAEVAEAYERGGWVFTSSGIHIPTLEGTHLAQPDDMVIRGVAGEFYPCKPEIFAATYELQMEMPSVAPGVVP